MRTIQSRFMSHINNLSYKMRSRDLNHWLGFDLSCKIQYYFFEKILNNLLIVFMFIVLWPLWVYLLCRAQLFCKNECLTWYSQTTLLTVTVYFYYKLYIWKKINQVGDMAPLSPLWAPLYTYSISDIIK